MSEEIPGLGEIAYVGYFKASDGKSLVSGAPLPAWDEQAPGIRQAWNLAAMAVVDRWSEPGDEPEPAKVIVVTEAGGKERRYRADSWSVVDFVLQVGIDFTDDDGNECERGIASYPPNAWLSVREDGALVPDGAMRKLGIALDALRSIAAITGPDDGTAPDTAQQALYEIAEGDL